MISLDDLSLNMEHIHMEHLNKTVKHDFVIGLPMMKFIKDRLYDACQKGKKTKVSCKPKNVETTTRPLKLIHMHLFGPSRTRSFGGNVFALFIVDDYSRYT